MSGKEEAFGVPRIYNSPKTMLKRKHNLRLLVLLLCMCISAYADDLRDPAIQLANKIAAITGPGTASLKVQSQTALSQDQVTTVRRTIETQLRSRGVNLRDSGDAAVEVSLIFSKNVRGSLWIAQVKQGGDVRVGMVEIPRSETAANLQSSTTMMLRKTFLVARPVPILDALTISVASENRLVVLEAESIGIYAQLKGRWIEQQRVRVDATHILPRDTRGRLVLAQDHAFDAYLPGTVCSSNASLPITITCREADDPWPIGLKSAFFNTARNYFGGMMSPAFGREIPPFYSAASLPRSNYNLWIFAGVNGRLLTYDGVNLVALNEQDWGSDIASVRSGCGTGTQVLATALSNGTPQDAIRAFEIYDRLPSAASASLNFDGPITALWTSSPDSASAAVVRNVAQDSYEAYSVSVTCN